MTEQQIVETLATKVMRFPSVFAYEGRVHVGDEKGSCRVWDPLQNIADAWQVVEKLVLEQGKHFEMQSSIREFRVSFDGEI